MAKIWPEKIQLRPGGFSNRLAEEEIAGSCVFMQ